MTAKNQTKREKFLAEMLAVAPRQVLPELIDPQEFAPRSFVVSRQLCSWLHNCCGFVEAKARGAIPRKGSQAVSIQRPQPNRLRFETEWAYILDLTCRIFVTAEKSAV